MYKRVIKTGTLFFIISLIYGCDKKDEKKTLANIKKNNNIYMLKDIPEYRSKSLDLQKKTYELANLQDLKEGVKGLELRVIYSNYDGYDYIIRITNFEGNWKAYFVKLVYAYDSSKLKSIDKTETSILSSIPLNNIVDSLTTLRFLSLPDFYTNPNNKDYDIGTDHISISFEIADEYLYRYYSYPHRFKSTGDDYDNVCVYKICSFLNTHFNLPVKIIVPTGAGL